MVGNGPSVLSVVCKSLDMMLGANSDDLSQTSYQLYVAGKGVLD